MNRKIRVGVFETNSSSTHSVSIYNRSKRVFSDIPRDSEVILDDSHSTGMEIFDEIGKLNFIVTMLASIVERKCDYEELEVKSFEEMVNLNWFRWLAEVVKEESNTEVIYNCPKYSSYLPYYDTTYDECKSIESIFVGGNSDVMCDETKFKERVKDIIYNPSVIIEDKENEY